MSRQSSAGRVALAHAAPVFAALGDETRLGLVVRLCAEGPLSIVRLSDGMDVTRQAVTKHLHALADAGLVHGERKGREQIWRIEVRRLADAQRWLDWISTQWDEVLKSLRVVVELDRRSRSSESGSPSALPPPVRRQTSGTSSASPRSENTTSCRHRQTA